MLGPPITNHVSSPVRLQPEPEPRGEENRWQEQWRGDTEPTGQAASLNGGDEVALSHVMGVGST